jgi:hypothetical protein
MTNQVSKCPACGGSDFVLERIRCTDCGTAVEGSFQAGKLGSLPAEHQDFIEVFVRCRGNIKDVEKVLGVSYPTVRSKLNQAVQALGYGQKISAHRKKEILKALEREEITSQEALRALEEGEE